MYVLSIRLRENNIIYIFTYIKIEPKIKLDKFPLFLNNIVVICICAIIDHPQSILEPNFNNVIRLYIFIKVAAHTFYYNMTSENRTRILTIIHVVHFVNVFYTWPGSIERKNKLA